MNSSNNESVERIIEQLKDVLNESKKGDAVVRPPPRRFIFAVAQLLVEQQREIDEKQRENDRLRTAIYESGVVWE